MRLAVVGSWKPQFRSFFSLGLSIGLVCLVVLAAEPQISPARAEDKEKEKIPDPEDVDLTTKDGLEMRATYYGSIKKKEAVPIILLHGYKGDRHDFDDLALYLQQQGYAVIVPDLRGHGESVRIKVPGSGAVINLEAAKLRKEDFAMMYAPGLDGEPSGDVEAVKKFLMKKNNAGELNIEKLCVLGTEMGSTVALNWAAADWGWPVLATGKQGQDVKALILVSPESNFRGISTADAVSLPEIRRDMSTMFIVGKGGGKSMQDASRLYKSFEKYRPAPPADPKERTEKQDLFFIKPNTSLQGTKMLNEASLKLNATIALFIKRRLESKKYPWTDRTSKIE